MEALSSDPLAFGTQGASSNARTTRKSLNGGAGYGQSLNSGASHGQSLKSGLTSRQSLNSGSSAQQSIKRGPSSPEQRSNRTDNPSIQFILPSDLPDLSDLFSTGQASNSTTLGPNSQLSLAKEALLQARDLIVQAYSLTKNREEQARILDLIKLFREYIEKGTLRKTSAIISSQVSHLERATRQIESKAKTLFSSKVPS